MTKKKSIQGMKSLAKVVGLSAVMVSTAYATHDDVAAVISDYVGSAAFITTTATGVVTSAPVTSPESISGNSYGIGLGDFDNDGLADYLVGGYNSTTGDGHIEFVKRTAAGNSFAAGVTIAGVSGNAVMDFAVADYNQDGNLDFAYNNYGSQLNDVYLGNGDGTFTLHAELPIPFWSIGMDSDDINNDGNPDFVSPQYSGYDHTKTVIQTHLGDGSGGFTSQTHVLDTIQSITYEYPWGLSLTDLNNDGKADLIVSIRRSAFTANNLLEVHLGNGDGTFAEAASATGHFPTADPYILNNPLAAIDDDDFNHDGNRDIIMTISFPQRTLVFFGNGDGTLTPSAQGTVLVSTTQHYELNGISTAPHLTYTNSPPVAEAGGPYVGTTDEVTIEVNSKTLNLDASGKWVKVRMSTDPDGTALVNLDGSASTDADNDAMTYDWVVTDNANGATTNLTGETPSIDLPQGSYTVVLTVTDPSGETSTDSSSIEVSLLDVETVVAANVFLNGVAGVSDQYLSHEDDPDKDPEQVIRFDHAAVSATLEVGEAELIEITGAVTGSTTIKTVRSKGKV